MEDPFHPFPLPSLDGLKNFLQHCKKSRLMYVGVFIILFAIIIVGYHARRTADQILNIVPVDTIVYATATDTSADSLPAEMIAQAAIAYSQYDRQLIAELRSHADRMSLIIFPDSLMRWQFAYGFVINDNGYLAGVTTRIKRYKIIDHKVLIISPSDDAILKIADVRRGQLFSLASQVPAAEFIRHGGTLFISSAQLKNFSQQQASLPLGLLGELASKDIYVLLDKKSDQWQFSVHGIQSQSDDTQAPLPTAVPKDVGLYIKTNNLVTALLTAITRNSTLADTMAATTVSLESTYQINLSALSKTLSQQPIDVMLFGRGDNTALGYEFALAMPPQSAQTVTTLQQLIPLLLAQKLPRQVLRPLPDGTAVTELIADPTAWQWQTSSAHGVVTSVIAEPKLGFDLALQTDQSRFIIASPSSLLPYLQSSSTVPIPSLASCPNLNRVPIQFVIRQTSFFPGLKPLLADRMILAGTDRQGSIVGCIQ